jgi:DNA polymerase sigma
LLQKHIDILVRTLAIFIKHFLFVRQVKELDC